MSARTLSRAYGIALYRGSRDRAPRYSPVGGSKSCVECAARQHETHGQLTEGGGVRATAKTLRHFPGADVDASLLLCHEHAQLWRERDTSDGVPAGRPR